jgi:hypothetical protein
VSEQKFPQPGKTIAESSLYTMSWEDATPPDRNVRWFHFERDYLQANPLGPRDWKHEVGQRHTEYCGI